MAPDLQFRRLTALKIVGRLRTFCGLSADRRKITKNHTAARVTLGTRERYVLLAGARIVAPCGGGPRARMTSCGSAVPTAEKGAAGLER